MYSRYLFLSFALETRREGQRGYQVEQKTKEMETTSINRKEKEKQGESESITSGKGKNKNENMQGFLKPNSSQIDKGAESWVKMLHERLSDL